MRWGYNPAGPGGGAGYRGGGKRGTGGGAGYPVPSPVSLGPRGLSGRGRPGRCGGTGWWRERAEPKPRGPAQDRGGRGLARTDLSAASGPVSRGQHHPGAGPGRGGRGGSSSLSAAAGSGQREGRGRSRPSTTAVWAERGDLARVGGGGSRESCRQRRFVAARLWGRGGAAASRGDGSWAGLLVSR